MVWDSSHPLKHLRLASVCQAGHTFNFAEPIHDHDHLAQPAVL